MAIRTTYDPKPIPPRQFDWTAVSEDYEPGDAIGYGQTELQAVLDLAEQLLERAAESVRKLADHMDVCSDCGVGAGEHALDCRRLER